jgi:hypothetical protein
MENSRTFSVCRVSVRECEDHGTDEYGMEIDRKSGIEALEYMADVLRAYGLEVEVTRSKAGGTVSLSIAHPEPYEAETLRNRGGGRPKERRTYGVSLDWLESHTVEEGMEALGVKSRSTYYRRLREIRERVPKT